MRKTLLISSILLCSIFVNAQIFQFHGPNRDGKFPEINLLKEWPENGPELLLEVEGIGKGFSSVISDGNFIYVTGKIDTLDYLTCIDFEGNKKWQTAYGEAWKKSFPDSRSTSTIEDDRIYVLSGIGELACINAINGEIIWKVNVDKKYHADWHIWGVSESPLIVGNKVICTPGGNETSVVAFDKMNGQEVWKTQSVGGQRPYSSPTIFNYNNRQYIMAMTAQYLLLLNPETGKVEMKYRYYDENKWTAQPGLIWTNIPLYKNNEVFVSTGYDYPAKMLRINADSSRFDELYTDTIFDNHHHGLIELDGYIYGSNWETNGKGNWLCKNWETGEITYNTTWMSKGSMIYADGLLYVYEEQKGTIAIVQPDPNAFKVISSFEIGKGTGPHWAHPYIYDGKLFLRHGDVLVVYNIKA